MSNVLERLDQTQRGRTRPKHERFRNHLLSAVASGRLQPGEALPSEMELAQSLGIGRNTVRRVLAELAQKGVISRVHGKGTFIHKNARRSVSESHSLFALVMPETKTGFHPSLQQGFNKAAVELEHQVIVCDSENDIRQQADIILQLMDNEVAGVAILPVTRQKTPAHQVRQLQKRGIPVVFCHREVPGVQSPTLAIPFREVGRRAGQAILEHGHRRVAFYGIHRSEAALGQEAGLHDVLGAAGAEMPEEFVHYGSLSTLDISRHETEIREHLHRIMQRPDRPTAILTSFVSNGELIHFLLGRLGLRVPEDVSLITSGGEWREGAIHRLLTTVTVDEVDTARRAVKLLDEMQQGKRPLDDDEQFTLPLGMIDGYTLGPAPQGQTSVKQ